MNESNELLGTLLLIESTNKAHNNLALNKNMNTKWKSCEKIKEAFFPSMFLSALRNSDLSNVWKIFSDRATQNKRERYLVWKYLKVFYQNKATIPAGVPNRQWPSKLMDDKN